jgi:predicted phosphoribosyltransferase
LQGIAMGEEIVLIARVQTARAHDQPSRQILINAPVAATIGIGQLDQGGDRTYDQET